MKLNIPVHYTDDIDFFNQSEIDIRKKIGLIVSTNKWIIDGNMDEFRTLFLNKCNKVIINDPGLLKLIMRTITRTVATYNPFKNKKIAHCHPLIYKNPIEMIYVDIITGLRNIIRFKPYFKKQLIFLSSNYLKKDDILILSN